MCAPENGTWYAMPVDCPICNVEHVSVHCACPDGLECPGCGYMIPAPNKEPGFTVDAR